MEGISMKLRFPRSIPLSFLLLFVITPSNAIFPFQNRTWPQRVYDGQTKFPTYAHFTEIINSINGGHASPLDAPFANLSIMNNLRVLQSPAMHLIPANVKDVQKIVVFAHHYNVHLCVRSSGHSYVGRSTHGGSVVVNMINMRHMEVNLESSRNPAGEITVQSGASWIEVYRKVDTLRGPGPNGEKKVGRVVVGASAHTVAIGGYTLGGGHSPIGRKLGLAVDNLLEAQIVTTDGKLLTLTEDKTIVEDTNGSRSESSDTSLFWAIRGGGGGTFGVVVTFTFALHYAPERFRNILVSYPLFSKTGERIYEESVKRALKSVSEMSEDWGGYIVLSPEPVPLTEYKGSMVLFLNHHGADSDDSNKEADEIMTNIPTIYKTDTKFKTFLEYENTVNDALYYSQYIASTFLTQATFDDDPKLDSLVDFIFDHAGDGIACAFTMIGGRVMQSNSRPATPIHPNFRNGKFSAGCGVGYAFNPEEDAANSRKALDMAEKLYDFGDGAYFNEPAEDMLDWKEQFWQDNETYDRLLTIKKQYDPDNYFWCHNCVGSDLGTGYDSPTYSPYPDPTTGIDFGDACKECNGAVAMLTQNHVTMAVVALLAIVLNHYNNNYY